MSSTKPLPPRLYGYLQLHIADTAHHGVQLTGGGPSVNMYPIR